MSPYALSPFVPFPWASCCVWDDVFIQLSAERENWRLYWNPKRWLHRLSCLDQWGGESRYERKSEGLYPHEPMLAVNDDCVVLQVFFNNSKNNLLHNFARHWGETHRQVVTKVIPLAIVKNWNVCQLSVIWDLLWFYVSVVTVMETYTKVAAAVILLALTCINNFPSFPTHIKDKLPYFQF